MTTPSTSESEMAISASTRKSLLAHAQDEYPIPGCIQTLTQLVPHPESGENGPVVVGEEAHIRVQHVGGPRHDLGVLAPIAPSGSGTHAPHPERLRREFVRARWQVSERASRERVARRSSM